MIRPLNPTPVFRAWLVWLTGLLSGSIWAAEPGERLTEPLVINPTAASAGVAGDVAVAPDGRIITVWEAADADGTGVYLRIFESDGRPITNVVRVNETQAGNQSAPRVGVDAQGRAVVVWHGPNGVFGNDVFFRRYNRNGQPLSSETLANPEDPGPQEFPAIGVSPQGSFVVAWQSFFDDVRINDVFYRRFGANGAALAPVQRANAFTDGSQENVAVAMDGQGTAFLAWTSFGQDPLGTPAVYGRRVSVDGLAGPELRLSAEFADSRRPTVAGDPRGGFVLAWQDRSEGGAAAQRRVDADGSLGPLERFEGALPDTARPGLAVDARGRVTLGWPTAEGGRLRQALEGGGVLAQSLTDVREALALAVDPTGQLTVLSLVGSEQQLTQWQGPEAVDLAAALAAESETAAPGAPLRLRATLGNASAPAAPTGIAALDGRLGSALGARLGIDLPPGLGSLRIDADPGLACERLGNRLECAAPTPLGPGQTRSLTLDATAPDTEGPLGFALDVRHAGFDPVPGNDRATRTITVQQPRLRLEPASLRVEEGGAPVTAQLVAVPPPARGLDVSFVVETQGEAPRLTLPDAPLRLAGGQSRLDLPIAAPDDGRFTGEQTLRLRLLPGEGYALAEADTLSLARVDRDGPPRVGFSAGPRLTLVEGQGALSLPVRLSGPSAQPVSVAVSLSGPAADRAILLTPSLRLEPGETEARVRLEVPSDNRYQPPQPLSVRLGSPIGATLGSEIERRVEVIDAEPPPTLRFVGSAGQLGLSGAPLTVTVELSAASDAETRVALLAGGSARPGVDVALSTQTLVIPPGARQASLELTRLAGAEAAERSLLLRLDSPTFARIGEADRFLVTLTDDRAPALRFEQAALGVREDAGLLAVGLLITPALTEATTVGLSLGGTATPGQDYRLLSPNPLPLPVGADRVELLLELLDDTVFEGPETVLIQLDASPALRLEAPNRLVITIEDTDTPPLARFGRDRLRLGSRDPAVELAVRLSHPSAFPVELDLRALDQAGDRLLLEPERLRIPPGLTEAVFSLAPRPGLQLMAAEILSLQLGGQGGVQFGAGRDLIVELVPGRTQPGPSPAPDDGNADAPGSGGGLIGGGVGGRNDGGGSASLALLLGLLLGYGARRRKA